MTREQRRRNHKAGRGSDREQNHGDRHRPRRGPPERAGCRHRSDARDEDRDDQRQHGHANQVDEDGPDGCDDADGGGPDRRSRSGEGQPEKETSGKAGEHTHGQ